MEEYIMTLRELIAHLKLSGSATEIAAALNSKTVEVKDTTLHTYSWVASLYGADFVSAVDSILQAAGLEWVRRQLAGSGIDFSHPETIATVERLLAAGLITSDQAARIKEIGIRYISPYEQYFGEGSSVTEEMVAAALTPPVVERQERIATIRSDGRQSIVTVQIHEIYKDGSRVIKESFSTHNANPTQKTLLDQLVQTLNNYEGNS